MNYTIVFICGKEIWGKDRKDNRKNGKIKRTKVKCEDATLRGF